MNILKKLLCTALIATLVFACACSNQDETTKTKVEAREQTPAEIVEYALKSLRGNSFEDVGYFGGFDDTNLSGKIFYNTIFENMEYNIIKTAKNSDGTYTVEVEITNKDLSDIPSVNELKNMEELEGLTTFELQTIVMDTIAELEEFVTSKVDVVLIKGAKAYNITNKHDLYRVASGGYIGK